MRTPDGQYRLLRNVQPDASMAASGETRAAALREQTRLLFNKWNDWHLHEPTYIKGDMRASPTQLAKIKALGAEYDAERHRWYVPAGQDVKPFARWLAKAPPQKPATPPQQPVSALNGRVFDSPRQESSVPWVGRWACLSTDSSANATKEANEMTTTSTSPSAPRLFVLHLHKSGGTSFCASLAAVGILNRTAINCNTYFDRSAAPAAARLFAWPRGMQACDALGDPHEARCCRWQRAGAATAGIVFCESGHQAGPCGHGFDAALDMCPRFAYAVALREPLSRIYSHMCQHRTSATGSQTDVLLVMSALRNGTRPPARGLAWRFGPSAYDNYYVRSLAGGDAWLAPAGSLTEAHLRSAIAALDRFDVVLTLGSGVSEQLAAQLPCVAWAQPQVAAALGAGAAQGVAGLAHAMEHSCPFASSSFARLFSAAQAHQLKHANRWDIALFAHAERLARRRVEGTGNTRGTNSLLHRVLSSLSQDAAEPFLEASDGLLFDWQGVQAKSRDKLLSRARALRANPVIVTFASISYWSLAVNFLAALARVDRTLPSRVGIVCLDARTASNLENLGAPCLTHIHPVVNNRSGRIEPNSLWKMRLQLAHTLTSNGIGVLFSDLDAIWQADATVFYHEHAASVVASRGVFPASVNAAWGATLCMGHISFKPTTGGVVLLSELVEACGIACNDQIVINEVLLTRARLQWVSVPGQPKYSGPALRRGKGVLRGSDVSVVCVAFQFEPFDCSAALLNDCSAALPTLLLCCSAELLHCCSACLLSAVAPVACSSHAGCCLARWLIASVRASLDGPWLCGTATTRRCREMKPNISKASRSTMYGCFATAGCWWREACRFCDTLTT